MNEPSYLTTTRASYDTVADDYAELVKTLFRKDPLGRAMLTAFGELVGPDRPVADIGCGPGQVTAYLDALGLSAFGVDLSPKMIEIARRAYPHLRFDVGSMTALDLADGELGGIVAWWSIFHTPPEVLPVVFSEFHRTLAAGGHLVVGFHVGDEHLRPERSYGHPVTYDAYLFRPDHITELLGQAGLVVTATLVSEGKKWPQACLLAHRPGESVDIFLGGATSWRRG
ncbi:class I SAM-dependent methyltransferase [Amycolatopsis sp.]|uniref:class I SAM-dependent DNA methyltransferase n=1 Tax=Amycolatopsis sp. TaxID=37632 RepID=UPI002E0C4F49|nr:class I SAM-dependent methyltransferase [Amycolatopsis sp.]